MTIGGYCGYKFYKHEKRQSEEINRLKSSISLIEAKVNRKNNKIEWLDTGYNYLAIGNSITSHPLADYWWNENVGMAASTEDKDYVHLIGKWLKDNKKEEVMFQAYNFCVWEVQAKDRAETLSLLDPYLSDKLDLITIQLSENATDIATFETDCVELYRYISKRAPEAQIIVIDDFWDAGDKANVKQKAAETCGIDFISLSNIKGNKEFQAGKGTVVYDKAGGAHIIEHDGVAIHPGDDGMTYIAEAVEKIIR